MAEFEDQLNQILSSPETMEQILSLAGALEGGAFGGQPEEAPKAETPSSEDPFGNLLEGLDFGMIAKLMELMGSLKQPSEKEQLLQAMRPFLRAERVERLDKAIQGARMSRIIRQAIQLLGKEG